MARTAENNDKEVAERGGYPLYGLRRAMDVAGFVGDLGGAKTPIQKSLIAQRMLVEDSSAALNQSIGATKTFGFIVGRGAYKLTDVGAAYCFPRSPDERQRALLVALKTPTVFEKLIERFDGARVPTSESLANILHRDHEISESWRPRVASLFLSSLKEAGVIDAAGFLRYTASLHGGGGSNIAPMNNAVQQPADQPPQNPAPASQPRRTETPLMDVSMWMHQGLRLEIPQPLTLDLWETLSEYVKVIKPKGHRREN